MLVDIPGYEGLYQACPTGRIWGIKRKNFLALSTGGTRKYATVALCKNGVSHCQTVHRIMALTFLGERPDGYVINHLDGNRLNNAIDNLQYCTVLENVRHAHEMGLANVSGVNNPNYKHGLARDRDHKNQIYNSWYRRKHYAAHSTGFRDGRPVD